MTTITITITITTWRRRQRTRTNNNTEKHIVTYLYLPGRTGHAWMSECRNIGINPTNQPANRSMTSDTISLSIVTGIQPSVATIPPHSLLFQSAHSAPCFSSCNFQHSLFRGNRIPTVRLQDLWQPGYELNQSGGAKPEVFGGKPLQVLQEVLCVLARTPICRSERGHGLPRAAPRKKLGRQIALRKTDFPCF